MRIEKAIEAALKAGWKPSRTHVRRMFYVYHRLSCQMLRRTKAKGMVESEILLDPLFWQALGLSMSSFTAHLESGGSVESYPHAQV